MKSRIVIAFIFLFCLMSAMLFAQKYVVLLRSGVNVRVEPDMQSIIVGDASKGQLYLFAGEEKNWLTVQLFSGEKRYISKAMAAALKEEQIVPQHYLILPKDTEKRTEIIERIGHAKNRAKREAEMVIPISLDAKRHAWYLHILSDRYILEVFRNYEIHPALYDELQKEAQTKKR